MTDAPLIWLLAGEASGDVLGSRLMAALRKQQPDVRFAGVGGPRMTEAGLISLFPMRDLAVMGLVEILPRIRSLSRRLDEAVTNIEALRPDLVVTIDSPGFSLRLLRRIAPLRIPRVQYVAPQVWAWREHRVRKFPGLWEKLLVLLPFEETFFQKHDLDAHFVGHPVLQSEADRGDAHRFRQQHHLQDAAPILILMPGSRRSEAPRLLPVFGAMLTLLKKRMPDIVPVIPVSPIVADTVRKATALWPVQPLIVTEITEKHEAFAAASAALTKSGTSTLELALAGVPMAVTYRVNPLTAAIARRLIRVPHVAMVNLLAREALVPELLQEDCRPDKLAQTVIQLMTDPLLQARQKKGFQTLLTGLRAPGQSTPADAAASEILSLLREKAASLPSPHPES
ncbi:lipid-A-disaccharide synthase [Acetobacter sp.]|jgi:lipid-A-disaccharide synthase|uniref:lipid-A-disaccharide synthase n=1 Tax=Acetobacter sp. TaxID=440 RepID=UPI0025B9F50B|nr:lipid-A-disaccharide synthase [Acetobacter sp.]MCH4090879.1 lipid-A-disaccharide synthase [Acetobacter sp.]MCI1301037.1 lipid-A-disaccharide synthase [Acetobacter sp.]MCI1317361.1 lipid-A-disaccharide synthase [Acetobacter sp.]